MKAVIWEGVDKLRYLEEHPEPTVKPGWVKIKVMSAGVCTTDLHIIKGRTDIVEAPTVLGHEICGDVVEAGEGCVDIMTGDRVVVETVVSCGVCESCLTANKHLCKDAKEIGLSDIHGGYAQYVTAPASCCHRIPDSMSYDEGGILEAMVCPFGAVYRYGLKPNDTVLVLGAGIAGLSFIQAARCYSPAKIIATSSNAHRSELARRYGADVIIDPRREDIAERVMEETDGVGVTLAIDAVGVQSTVLGAINSVKKGGRVILYGLPDSRKTIPFPVQKLIMDQISVTGVTNNELAWEPLIGLIEKGRINAKDMVTHSFRLDELDKAIALLDEHPDELIKAVIHPQE